MLYGMAPRRFRWAALLLASYGTFFALSGALIAFVALVDGQSCTRAPARRAPTWQRMNAATGASQLGQTREIREACKRKNRRIVFAAVVANIGILAVLEILGVLRAVAGFRGGGVRHFDPTFPSPASHRPSGYRFTRSWPFHTSWMCIANARRPTRTLGTWRCSWALFPGNHGSDRSAETTTLRPASSAGEPLNRKKPVRRNLAHYVVGHGEEDHRRGPARTRSAKPVSSTITVRTTEAS